MILRNICVATAVMLAACGVRSAFGEEDKLAERIAELIEGDRYRHAHWGILAVDLESGETVYAHNAEKLFPPASTTKLYSVAAAHDALGPDYRFETPVFARGEVKDGVLHGDLILRASGDLTMGGRTTVTGEIEFTNSDHTYANGNSDTVLTKQDPLAGLADLARQVAAEGIKSYTGRVIVDDRLFRPAESSGSGPTKVTPILINDNVVDIIFAPGEKGKPAKITCRPEGIYSIDNEAETVGKGEGLETWFFTRGDNRLLVRGKIPEGHAPVVRVFEVPDPRVFAEKCFAHALKQAGVAGPDQTPEGEAKLPEDDEYKELRRVALLTSPPFAENARLVMKVSHNLHASTLPLLIAAHHGKRTLDDGLRLERKFLEKAGVPVDSVSFGGGAGGARSDYVTPAATVALLRYMAKRDDFPLYERTLPIMGVDGTLSSTVSRNSAAREKVQAKTGTLFWTNGLDGSGLLTSKALAGYMTTNKSRRLAFAFYVTGVPLRGDVKTGTIGRDLGKLSEIFVEER